MKNNKKVKANKIKTAVAIMALILIVILAVYGYTHDPYKENESNTMEFRYDEVTGRTVPVGKDANKWIRIEDYKDDSVQVDFNTPYMHGNIPMYRGTVNGEKREATEEYWTAMLLSTQPTSFFGYVYIGD